MQSVRAGCLSAHLEHGCLATCLFFLKLVNLSAKHLARHLIQFISFSTVCLHRPALVFCIMAVRKKTTTQSKGGSGVCNGWWKFQSFVFWLPLVVLIARELQPRSFSVPHVGNLGAAAQMGLDHFIPPISEKELLAEGRSFLEPQNLEVVCHVVCRSTPVPHFQ